MVTLAELADNRGIVIAAYLSVLNPWGFMYLWLFIHGIKPSGNTAICRRHFLINSIFSVLSLAYLIFYTHLQVVKKNHSEMMLAIYGNLFIIAHIARTIYMFVHRDGDDREKEPPASLA